MTRTYKQWSATDLAFIVFARYKGLKNAQIAEIMGTSRPAVQQQFIKIKDASGMGAITQKKVAKAQTLEAQVRGGFAKDQRDVWLQKISRYTGITYSSSEPTEPEVEEVEEVEPEVETAEEETVELPPVLKLEINTHSIIAIIKAWRS